MKTLSDVVVEEDISKIEGFIKDKDQELRFYTISALSSIASARSIKIITECFCDDAWLLRRHAADSLDTDWRALYSAIIENFEG